MEQVEVPEKVIESLYDLSFLSFLKPIPFEVLKKNKRKVYHGDEEEEDKKAKSYTPIPPKGSPDYGKNRPLVLNAMKQIGKACTFAQIQEIVKLDKSTVRMWVGKLEDEKVVVKVRDATRGKDKLCSLWKLI